MKIIIFSNTPAQIYMYNSIHKQLSEKGHSILFLIRKYESTIKIANYYNLNYIVYNESKKSSIFQILDSLKIIINTYKIIKKFDADLIIGGGLIDSSIGKLLDIPVIGFTDGEPNTSLATKIQLKLVVPILDKIVTPMSYKYYFGNNQIRINSFKEMSYLHPSLFKKKEYIDGFDLSKNYAIIRLNNYDSLHDMGLVGYDEEMLLELISIIEKKMDVFLSTEGSLPSSLTRYQLTTKKEDFHQILCNAKLLITATGTAATEGAILGVPTIITYPNADKFGNFSELANIYNLLYISVNFEHTKKIITRLEKENYNSKDRQEKINKLIKNKSNFVDEFILIIESYNHE